MLVDDRAGDDEEQEQQEHDVDERQRGLDGRS
jgi:hypothetical protein